MQTLNPKPTESPKYSETETVSRLETLGSHSSLRCEFPQDLYSDTVPGVELAWAEEKLPGPAQGNLKGTLKGALSGCMVKG